MPRAMAAPWVARLLEELQAAADCELCVAAPFRVTTDRAFIEDGVQYVFLPQARKLHYWTYRWEGLAAAAELIDDYRPDLVHVHGSEHCLGLAHVQSRHRCRAILSLQGILTAIAPKALGDLDRWTVFRRERWIDLARMSGVLGTKRTWRQGAIVEQRVLAAQEHIIGHNAWDRAQVAALNPKARYHHVGEPLRREFYNYRWTVDSARAETIFFGNLAGAHKGGHTILRALTILAKDFPGVTLRVAGRLDSWRGYGKLFLDEATRLGLRDRMDFLGFLDAESMAKELSAASVFVSASHADNNPNSVAEAQIVGTPVVASYVGGVPEMLDDGRAGLLFPVGDAAMLAAQISRVFTDRGLAQRLSDQGRQRARQRHDPAIIVDELLAAYSAAGCTLPSRRES
jgi:glycosyltransferase involved in cell wall biosynthesis